MVIMVTQEIKDDVSNKFIIHQYFVVIVMYTCFNTSYNIVLFLADIGKFYLLSEI